ncbi:E3 ubiquitin-protein ligase RHF2A-like [Ceratitis capitata]|uniref:E3 ubiquitin-protein ligase RHF2A-like n=1 Tax=Ceratitis capitata TaxID=7213 RepID=UPI00032A1199|nr:E3 ubiquitin-protein ligase RHF2A-like [Ceratitis capitata]
MPTTRHSNESLPLQVNACVICRTNFSENDEVLTTICSHKFHRHCLLNGIKRNSACPQCQTACNIRDFVTNTGMRTRSKRTVTNANTVCNNPDLDSTRHSNHPEEGAMSLPVNTDNNNDVNANRA